jgi:hypothetical protein
VVLFALFGAALTAYLWALACPAKPLVTFLVDEAKAIGFLLLIFTLPGILARKNPFLELRNFALPLTPFFGMGLVPPVTSMMMGWKGGWGPGIAGAAAGTAAGAVNGWLFQRSIMPEYEKRRARASAARLTGLTDGPGVSGSMADQ